jgi:D-amino-acid dehydrogenase
MARVIVAGAGIIGLGIAAELIWRDHEVVVVDPRTPGSAASTGNTGWIVPVLSAPIPSPGLTMQVLRWMGDPDAPFRLDLDQLPGALGWLARFLANCRDSRHQAGLNALGALNAGAIEAFDRWESAGLTFERARTGVTFLAENPDSIEHLSVENAKLERFGYPPLERLDATEIRKRFPMVSDRIRAGLRAPREEIVWPDSVLTALIDQVSSGGRFVQGSVRSVRPGRSHRFRVKIDDHPGTLEASHLVIAAGSWSGQLARILGVRLPVIAGAGYSVTVENPGLDLPEPLYLAEARIASTPFTGRNQFAGLMELRSRERPVDSRRVMAMHRALDRYLPGWNRGRSRKVWSGSRPMTPDGLPVIGPIPDCPGGYVATGHGMLGVTMAPLTAGIVADLIAYGKSEADLFPFRIDRF